MNTFCLIFLLLAGLPLTNCLQVLLLQLCVPTHQQICLIAADCLMFLFSCEQLFLTIAAVWSHNNNTCMKAAMSWYIGNISLAFKLCMNGWLNDWGLRFEGVCVLCLYFTFLLQREASSQTRPEVNTDFWRVKHHRYIYIEIYIWHI